MAARLSDSLFYLPPPGFHDGSFLGFPGCLGSFLSTPGSLLGIPRSGHFSGALTLSSFCCLCLCQKLLLRPVQALLCLLHLHLRASTHCVTLPVHAGS